MALKNR